MLDAATPNAAEIAIADGLVQAMGNNREIMALGGNHMKVVDLNGRRIISGLNDNHTHLIRGGLSYDMELRWEGVPGLHVGSPLA